MARNEILERWRGVQRLLRAEGDPSGAAWYRSAAPTAGTVLGISVPAIRRMVKEFLGEHKGLTPSEAAGMADIAFASGCREEMLFATFVLARFKAKLAPEHWKSLGGWIDGIDTWEACDQLAMGVGGEMIARAEEPYRSRWIADLEAWAASRNPWRRRFAVAATTVLNQKGRKDADAALRICRRVLQDEDVSVRKAVGWALREACKSDADAVFAFLKKHREAMPRGVLRESAKKLSERQQEALGLR